MGGSEVERLKWQRPETIRPAKDIVGLLFSKWICWKVKIAVPHGVAARDELAAALGQRRSVTFFVKCFPKAMPGMVLSVLGA